MNRTQRAMLRSVKRTINDDRKQKNSDIRTRNELAKMAKAARGARKSRLIRDIRHLTDCINRENHMIADERNDILIYKERFESAAKNTRKEFIVM